MKPLSESLMDLAARVKRLEDSAAAVREQNRAALQARREELETVIDREVKELRRRRRRRRKPHGAGGQTPRAQSNDRSPRCALTSKSGTLNLSKRA